MTKHILPLAIIQKIYSQNPMNCIYNPKSDGASCIINKYRHIYGNNIKHLI